MCFYISNFNYTYLSGDLRYNSAFYVQVFFLVIYIVAIFFLYTWPNHFSMASLIFVSYVFHIRPYSNFIIPDLLNHLYSLIQINDSPQSIVRRPLAGAGSHTLAAWQRTSHTLLSWFLQESRFQPVNGHRILSRA